MKNNTKYIRHNMKHKRQIVRFILILGLMLFYAYRPISSNERMNLYPGVYRISGKDGCIPGKYVVNIKNDNQLACYQLCSSDSMELEDTIEAHVIYDKKEVYLAEGQYIKLVNCTAKKEIAK